MKKILITLSVILFAAATYGSVLLTSEKDSSEPERSMPAAFSSINKSLQRTHAPNWLITFDDLVSKQEASQNLLTTPVYSPLSISLRSVTDGIPALYGLLESSKGSSSTIGMYNVGIDGSSELLWARPHTDKTALNYDAETFRTGFCRNGDVYVFERSENGVYGHEAYSSEMFVYDLATGELKQKTDLSIADAKMQMFLSMAYDPVDDMVYAYTISYDIDTPYYLVKFKPDSPQEITTIATTSLMSTVLALTWHEGALYGIQYQGYTFVRVDPATGRQNAISKPFASAPRFAWSGFGMTWVDSLDGFVLNHIYNNGSSSFDLLKFDGSLEKLVDLPGSEQFAFLFTAGEVSESDDTPSKPVITANTFEGSPAREGSFTLTIPSTYADGRSIAPSTPIALTATAGTIAGIPDKATYAAGETATVQFALPSDGRYSFEFRVSIGEGFASSAQMMYVGYDVPSRPGNVLLVPGKLSWDAVTAGVNKGYFEPAEVRYDVTIDGKTVASGIDATEYAVDFTEGDLMRHTASVVATHHGHSSESVLSNDLVDGRPMPLDAVLVPTAEQAQLFTVIDSNADGSTWEFASDDNPADSYFKYRLNSYRKADDWLVTPPVAIPDASNLYSFMIEANRVSGYPELFEVKMGTNPDPTTWTTVLIPETEVPVNAVGAVYQPYTVDFNVPDAGTYYFAVHCTSAADMHTLK
ncbi:MAG: choice-of-anchor J domain-containing protein, partial [Muribaculaceae bacterium]|nr:choice-of-anchor J domain-containing protein [Muribaculaceae bacterium]